MHEYRFVNDGIHDGALHQALKTAMGARFVGISTYGAGRPFSVWLASPTDEAAAIAVITAHDPVRLSVDTPSITADGIDTANVLIQTIRPDAAPVTLLVNGTPVRVQGGAIQISSDDPTTITITVQNPANRTTDTLIVEAL